MSHMCIIISDPGKFPGGREKTNVFISAGAGPKYKPKVQYLYISATWNKMQVPCICIEYLFHVDKRLSPTQNSGDPITVVMSQKQLKRVNQ